MPYRNIPDDVRRLLLMGPLSVPHVEAALLLRHEHQQPWDAQRLAMRIYVADKVAARLLSDLAQIGICECIHTDPDTYHYQPATPELAQTLGRLDETYARHLIDVTRLIHAAADPAAREFAAAFRFREGS